MFNKQLHMHSFAWEIWQINENIAKIKSKRKEYGKNNQLNGNK